MTDPIYAKQVIKGNRKLKENDNFRGIYINSDKTAVQLRKFHSINDELKVRTEKDESVLLSNIISTFLKL